MPSATASSTGKTNDPEDRLRLAHELHAGAPGVSSKSGWDLSGLRHLGAPAR